LEEENVTKQYSMSKKDLRTINEQTNKLVKTFSSMHTGLRVRSGALTVGQVSIADQKTLANSQLDEESFFKILDKAKATPSEMYVNMFPLEIPAKGSIKSLGVSAYSAEANTEVLLHKLFDKVRE
jgi:hypothetical protein